jgi:hypothetical protein
MQHPFPMRVTCVLVYQHGHGRGETYVEACESACDVDVSDVPREDS